MPRTTEETKIIHADWWSDKKDSAEQYLERCTIRRFTFADRQRLGFRVWDSRGQRSIDELRADEGVTEEQFMASTLSELEIGIVEMTDPDGTLMAVTSEVLSLLDGRDAEFILRELHELNPQLEANAAERESFQG